MATTFLSSAAFCARPGAWAGSPWESYSLSVTLQSGLLLFHWSMASSAPLRMLMPRLAESPVSAPKYPICMFDGHFPPLASELLLLLEPHAAATRANPRSTAGSRHQWRCCRIGNSLVSTSLARVGCRTRGTGLPLGPSGALRIAAAFD